MFHISSKVVVLESVPDGIFNHHNVQRLLLRDCSVTKCLSRINCYFMLFRDLVRNDSFMLVMDTFNEFYSPILCRLS